MVSRMSINSTNGILPNVDQSVRESMSPSQLNKCRNIWNKSLAIASKKQSHRTASHCSMDSLQVHLKENRLCKIAIKRFSTVLVLTWGLGSTTFNLKGVYVIAIDGSSLGKEHGM